VSQSIQEPGVGQALQAAFNLQGRVRPVLEEYIVPTVMIADFSAQASGVPLARSAAARLTVGATIGEMATMRFEMPAGMLAKIVRFHAFPSADGNLAFSFSSAGAPQAVPFIADFLDGRLVQLGQTPVAGATGGTQIGTIAPISLMYRAQNAIGGLTLEPEHWVVGSGVPGQFGFFEAQLTNVNSQCQFAMEWIEYPVF